MLKPRVAPWRSIRFASQLAEDGLVKTVATISSNAESARKPPSILSRLSDRTRSKTRRDSDGGDIEDVTAAHKVTRRATSFVSVRSARKRDHAAEKWFTDVRELDISNVDQPDNLESLPRKHRRSNSLRKHEMRPRTDLNALFAPSSVRSATSMRIQTKKELGGDYTSYLPDGCVDPHQLPVAYARLVLGRNKHIPLNAQTGALNIIEEVIRGKAARQG